MPTSQNPLRTPVLGASAEQRLELVKLAVDNLGNEEHPIKILDDEVRRGGVSFTIDTLRAFTKANPDFEFSLVIGADQLESFNRWKEFKEILELANLIVTNRPGIELQKDKEDVPSWVRELAKSFRGDKIILKSGRAIQFVSIPDVNVSGTEIRRKIRRQENVSHLVPAVVSEYLRSHSIYNEPDYKISDYTEFTKFCMKVLDNKGGLAVNAYDLREVNQPSEFTIATSGTSQRHTKALAEYVVKEAKDQFGIYPQSVEGQDEGRWVVVDYGPLIVHVFYDYVRNEYRIEELWSQAPRIQP